VEVQAPVRDLRVVVPRATRYLPLRGRLLGERVEGFDVRFKPDAGDQELEARSGPRGEFLIAGEGDRVGTLFARKRGDERFAIRRGARASGSPHDLVLETGLAIEGTIQDLPVDEEAIELLYVQGAPAQVLADVRSDGTFSVTGLPPGEYVLFGMVFGGRRQGNIVAEGPVAAGSKGVRLRFVRR
jgi:hypothetical protein